MICTNLTLPPPKKDMTDAEMVSLYQEQAKLHAEAFRAAYDLLTKSWPPVNTVEFFTKVYKAHDVMLTEHPGNPLMNRLLWEIYDYLGDTAKRWTDGIQTGETVKRGSGSTGETVKRENSPGPDKTPQDRTFPGDDDQLPGQLRMI